MLRRVGLALLALFLFAGSASAQLPNLLGDLKAERTKYPPQITAAQAGALLNAVALKHKAEGFGLLRKDAGNRCPLPAGGVTVSCDWIVHLPSGLGCDALGSGPDSDPPASGPASPQWCAGVAFDQARFVSPVDTGGGDTPPPDPPDPPPPASGAATAELQRVQLEALAAIVAKLQEQIDALAVQDTAQTAAIVQAVKDLKAEIAKGIKVRF